MSEYIEEIQDKIRPRANLGKEQLKKESVKVLRKYNNRRTRRRRR